MSVDYEALNALRKTYQARSEDVAQAWVEHWDLEFLTEAEATANAAGKEWLDAVHAAWPQIYAQVTR